MGVPAGSNVKAEMRKWAVNSCNLAHGPGGRRSGYLLFHKTAYSWGPGLLWCGLRAWSHFIIRTSSGRVTSLPMPSVASCSQNWLVATPDTFSPDEGWPSTSLFNLFTHKKWEMMLQLLFSYLFSYSSLFVPVFIQSFPGLSIIQTVFFHYLSQQAQHLKAKEQPVSHSLAFF